MAHRDRRRALSRFHRAASRSTRSATRIRIWSRRCNEQADKLWHVSNLFRIPEAERLAGRLCARKLCRPGILLQFRRRGHGMRHQDRRANINSSRAIPSGTASSLSKAPSMAARSRRSRPAASRNISKASAARCDGFDQVPFGDLDAVKARHRSGDRRHPDRADPGRRRGARGSDAVPAQALRDVVRRARPAACLRRGADRHRPHRQTCSPTSATASTPDMMGIAKATRRRFSIWRVSCHCRGRQGHDGRAPTARPSAAIRWRWRSATQCSISCWRRAFSTMCSSSRHAVQPALAEWSIATPGVIAEVRGEGLAARP